MSVMSPDEFRECLAVLTEHVTALVLLPLDEMTDYCDEVERRGRTAGDAWTPKRQETTAHVARMVAAVQHLRAAAAMGGD